jgi:hypothetical protein
VIQQYTENSCVWINDMRRLGYLRINVVVRECRAGLPGSFLKPPSGYGIGRKELSI